MSEQGYFMDIQPSDNQQPEPVVDGVSQVPSGKRHKKLIVAIVAGLVLLVAIIAAVVILTMPSKQDYKDLADGAHSAINSYGERLSQQTDRGLLYVTVLSKTTAASLDGQDVQRSIVLSYGEEEVSQIEQEEQATAKTIAGNEQFIDEQVAKMNDSEIKKAYGTYLQAREKMYGPEAGAEEFGESLAMTYRALYVCDHVINLTDLIFTEESAHEYLEYVKSCVQAAKKGIDSGVLVPIHQDVLGDLAGAADERMKFIEESLDGFDDYDFSVGIEQLAEGQQDKLVDSINQGVLLPHDEAFEALKKLNSLAAEKQRQALGSVKDT